MKLSIITPTYNSEKTISRTIESVQQQGYDNYEHIIIDGLSNDNTVNIVKEYMKNDNHIILVSEKDDGIYNAMNKGIRMSSGELIGIINSDDYYEPNAFSIVLDNYDSSIKYQVIYGLLRKILNGKEYEIYSRKIEEINKHMIPHPTCFVTRDTYEKFGMFDENYRLAADYEMMVRFSFNKEIEFICVNQIIANYTMGGASGTQKSDLEAITIRKKYGLINLFQYFIRLIKIKLLLLLGKNKKYDK